MNRAAEAGMAQPRAAALRRELRPLRRADLNRFKHAFAAARKRPWCYYFPFLLCYSHSPTRSVLWREEQGCLCVFLSRGTRRPRLDLFVPPIPFDPAALRWCVGLMNEWNGNRSGRILWCDAADARGLSDALGCSVALKEREYIYSPAAMRALSGSRWRTVRRNVRRIERRPGLHVRDYAPADAPACRDLLAAWENTQGRRHRGLFDRGYTRACLELAPQLPDRDLCGELILMDGEIRAFAFAGEMWPGMASFFVAKTDTRVRGLSYFQRWHVLQRFTDYEHINDASDLRHPGLRQFKRSLRPVRMVDVYSARQVEGIQGS